MSQADLERREFDVIVAGAGIVGAACAYELARRELSVLVIDRDIAGGGATAAGMGHVVVMDDSEAQFALTRYSRQLWKDLRGELPREAEYEECGTIWVAADDEEMAEVLRKRAYYSARGVAVEVLDANELKRREPNLRDGLAGGLLVPEDAVLYPPCVTRLLLGRAQMRGTVVRLGTPIKKIAGGAVTTADGAVWRARRIVNAAGTWAPDLTPGAPIRKRKGHLLITDRYPGFVRHQLVELGYLKGAHSLQGDSVAFNVQPRPTGQVLIGSSRQFDDEHAGVDHAVLERMLQRARAYMPGIGALCGVRAWTGFRAATPDKLPLIGPWPDDDSVWLATGHEGLGITTSLATAALLADLLTGKPTAIPAGPYLPERLLREGTA